MAAMAPERKNDIISLGARSILSGTLATMMSATVVGMIS
jgi:CNT family concentrative nucleoside transporter